MSSPALPSFALLALSAASLLAAPFQVHDSSELRPDMSASWSEIGTTHGTPFPDWQAFSTSLNLLLPRPTGAQDAGVRKAIP